MRIFSVIILSFFLQSCVSIPKGVEPVANFELARYLGEWYEIARLDHSFERGMERVSAEYLLRDDGGVKVLNRGYSTSTNKWEEAEGKAYFVDEADKGFLKVSFFGPFYGSYVIFELDKEEYSYAFVAGPDTSYLWFLSRTPTVEEELIDQFVQHAKELGFDTSELIFVDHDVPVK